MMSRAPQAAEDGARLMLGFVLVMAAATVVVMVVRASTDL